MFLLKCHNLGGLLQNCKLKGILKTAGLNFKQVKVIKVRKQLKNCLKLEVTKETRKLNATQVFELNSLAKKGLTGKAVMEFEYYIVVMY